MTNNSHIGSDVLNFLESIVPDTPEMQRVEKQERFRIALTQAMRDLRNRVGMTQKELAQKLEVGQSWVSKLESSNNDHTFESILAYLDALGADLKATFFLEEKEISSVCTILNPANGSREISISEKESNKDIENNQEFQRLDFPLLSSESKSKCEKANDVVRENHGSLWGAAA